LLFLPPSGQLKKHGENQRKQKKTCFFLFLFYFLTVFLIGALAQKENLRLLQHQNTMPTDRLTPHIPLPVVQ
jgi:hypothetical protein